MRCRSADWAGRHALCKKLKMPPRLASWEGQPKHRSILAACLHTCYFACRGMAAGCFFQPGSSCVGKAGPQVAGRGRGLCPSAVAAALNELPAGSMNTMLLGLLCTMRLNVATGSSVHALVFTNQLKTMFKVECSSKNGCPKGARWMRRLARPPHPAAPPAAAPPRPG